MKLIAALPVSIAFLAGALPAHAWTWPVTGPVLQPFSFGGDPYAPGQHRGIDVAAPPGALVRAPAGGTVSFAGMVPRNGRTLTIATPDGFSVTLVHLGSSTAARGDPVREGETVGTIGPTGEPEHAQSYVHLGIRVAADEHGYVDPAAFLPPAPVPNEPAEDATPPPSEPEPEQGDTGSVPESPAEERPDEPPGGETPGDPTPDGVPAQAPGEGEPAPSLPAVEIPDGLESRPGAPAVPALSDVPVPSPIAHEADAWAETVSARGDPVPAPTPVAVGDSPAWAKLGGTSDGQVGRTDPRTPSLSRRLRAPPRRSARSRHRLSLGVGNRHERLGSGVGLTVAASAIAVLVIGAASLLRRRRLHALERANLDLPAVTQVAAIDEERARSVRDAARRVARRSPHAARAVLVRTPPSGRHTAAAGRKPRTPACSSAYSTDGRTGAGRTVCQSRMRAPGMAAATDTA